MWVSRIAALFTVCLFVVCPASADLQLAPRLREELPLRIFHAKASDPACSPDCPEWLSVEGRIVGGSAEAFAATVEALRGRKLPILLSSRGGSVRDALKMGLLIREKGLDVVVARTLVLGCPERKPECPEARATATVGGAVCASACPLVLAGGIERVAGPVPQIGVHQMTSVVKEPTGAVGLTATHKIYEDVKADAGVSLYLGLMGIHEPIMTLLRETPAAGLRWLSKEEIAESEIATATLDAAEPILVAGVNGLNVRSNLKGTPMVLTASGRTGDDLPAKVTFAYRLGGGAVGLTFSGAGGPKLGIKLGTGTPLTAEPSPGGGQRAEIGRTAFCALDLTGTMVTTTSDGGVPYRFHLADVRGLKELFAAACP